MQKPVKIPDAEHPISVAPHQGRVRVTFNSRVVAETTRALKMREGGYEPVLYIPREDADLSLLKRTEHASYCPYKGEASYFSIHVGDRFAENAIWSYETPYPAVAPIKNHLAFYLNRVDAIEELPA